MLYRKQLIPKQNRFLLVRHGESIWNKDSKFTGWTNIPLTNKGKSEALKMAHAISLHNIIPNILFTSVLDRSIDTSNIIKKELNKIHNTDIPIYTSWRLNERHYGTLEGIPRQYIREMFGHKFTKIIRCNFSMKPPIIRDYKHNNDYPVYRNCYFNSIKYGESKENVLERVLPYYENDIMYTLSENKFPLIVTHKHTARVLMKHLMKISDEDFEQFELPNKKILLVNLKDDLSYESHKEIEY